MTDDGAAMVADPLHGARIVGTCTMPERSRNPTTISQGRFNLFVDERGCHSEKQRASRNSSPRGTRSLATWRERSRSNGCAQQRAARLMLAEERYR